jgi:hypothetical protein
MRENASRAAHCVQAQVTGDARRPRVVQARVRSMRQRSLPCRGPEKIGKRRGRKRRNRSALSRLLLLRFLLGLLGCLLRLLRGLLRRHECSHLPCMRTYWKPLKAFFLNRADETMLRRGAHWMGRCVANFASGASACNGARVDARTIRDAISSCCSRRATHRECEVRTQHDEGIARFVLRGRRPRNAAHDASADLATLVRRSLVRTPRTCAERPQAAERCRMSCRAWAGKVLMVRASGQTAYVAARS